MLEAEYNGFTKYDGGYTLHVDFINPNEDWLEEEEAEETIRDLFELTPGDFSLVLEYIEINGEDYGEEALRDLAIQIAEELGIPDFISAAGTG
jgi:hypothetical protein